VFCALVGALMRIAPHQFAGASFAPLRPWLTAWGAAFFADGVTIACPGRGWPDRGGIAVLFCSRYVAHWLVGRTGEFLDPRGQL